MHLVQLLIPVFDNEGRRFEQRLFEAVRAQLIERFGGLTAFVQAPAVGLWKAPQDSATRRDDMILVEVMTDSLDRQWWAAYRSQLEQDFRQDEIVVRAIACERI